MPESKSNDKPQAPKESVAIESTESTVVTTNDVAPTASYLKHSPNHSLAINEISTILGQEDLLILKLAVGVEVSVSSHIINQLLSDQRLTYGTMLTFAMLKSLYLELDGKIVHHKAGTLRYTNTDTGATSNWKVDGYHIQSVAGKAPRISLKAETEQSLTFYINLPSDRTSQFIGSQAVTLKSASSVPNAAIIN